MCSFRFKSLEERAWKGPEEAADFEMGCEVTSYRLLKSEMTAESSPLMSIILSPPTLEGFSIFTPISFSC
jgi:hypothetical protein